MEIEDQRLTPQFYRQLLSSAKVFLTEVDQRSSTSVSEESLSIDEQSRSRSPEHSIRNVKEIDRELFSTRQECHQRLLNCSRKKLRLLALQEQNDKRHLTFQRFLDNLDQKRSTNIYRYQLELRDYLLKRLETDRLKQQLYSLSIKIDQFNQQKKQYEHIIDIVQKAIPLFPTGSLQSGAEGVKSLILRYQTLVETKSQFEERDFSSEKQEKRQEFQRLLLEHHTRIAKLNTRLGILHQQLNHLQKNESIREETFLNQTEMNRLNSTIVSQLQLSINSLYDRYRLTHQTNQSNDLTISQKLKSIQEFILYRMDLAQKAKN